MSNVYFPFLSNVKTKTHCCHSADINSYKSEFDKCQIQMEDYLHRNGILCINDDDFITVSLILLLLVLEWC